MTAAASAAAEPYDPAKLDTYPYNNRFRKLQKVLWFCAGADIELMRRCPRSEQIKEEGIGGIVLATTVLAFLSGSYAMYIVFGPKVGLALSPEQQAVSVPALVTALVVGLIWALIVLNLDRFVVSSTGHGDGTDRITRDELFKALPRILMALIIGACLSAPLKIKIMESEIEAELRRVQTDRVETFMAQYAKNTYTPLVDRLEADKLKAEARIRSLEDQVLRKEGEIRAQRKKLDDEVAGRSGSGKSGKGPAYEVAEANLRSQERELEALMERSKAEVEQQKATLATLARDRKTADTARSAREAEEVLAATKKDGLITRVQLAKQIGGWSFFFVMALLMIIEVAPIFFKMMMPRGPYLSLLDNQNEIVLARYGITREAALVPGAGPEAVVHERFHQAETIAEHQVRQLAAERQLAEVAREKFVQMSTEDIRANPSRYMVRSPVTHGS